MVRAFLFRSCRNGGEGWKRNNDHQAASAGALVRSLIGEDARSHAPAQLKLFGAWTGLVCGKDGAFV